MTSDVLLVFSDNTLGGTSRSALMAARAWKLAGKTVSFLPARGVHDDRFDEMASLGSIVDLAHLSTRPRYQVVHFHHGSWSRDQLALAGSLNKWAADIRSSPLLITHNVFGVPDPVLRRWPGPRVVGTPTVWSRAQYVAASAPFGHSIVAVVPNAQDLSTFRPPSRLERIQSRDQLGLSSQDVVVVRVGSPHDVKWHSAYVQLVNDLTWAKFLFVGAPARLRGLGGHVTVLEQVSDVDRVRDFYWAADVFAHAAERGESFGNVLLESVAAGTPVVSMSRPARDNGPWEFGKRLRGIDVVSPKAWVAHIATSSSTPYSDQDLFADQGTLQRFYSLDALAAILGGLAAGVKAADANSQLKLSLSDWVSIYRRHNLAADFAKRVRLAVHR